MNLVRNALSELVERRLWPLAVGLLVALVAVPVVLSKPAGGGSSSSSPAATTLLGGASAKLLGETRPAVTVGTDGGFRKHVDRLARKNPFIQQARPKAKATDGEGVTTDTGSVTTGTPGGDSVTIPTTDTGSTPPSSGDQPTQFNYTANLKFGKIGETDSKTVLPTRALPSTSNPIVIFMGASGGGDQAVFVVASGVTARGDGECKPSADKCSFVYMSEGQVEFLEVAEGDTVTTYELELESIGTKTTNQTSQTKPRYGSQDKGSSPSRHEIERARDALRSKRVFKALDLLGF
jgi:hypothetical protein